MYNYIIDPKTNLSIKINSNAGHIILKKYIKSLIRGGGSLSFVVVSDYYTKHFLKIFHYHPNYKKICAVILALGSSRRLLEVTTR